MVRYRMRKLIKMLEHNKRTEVLKLYKTKPRYKKAFNNLEHKKIIITQYGDDELVEVCLDEYALAIYEYELEGAFLARLEGFCWGVAAAVASSNLLHALHVI